MQRDWLITVNSGLASKMRRMESKISQFPSSSICLQTIETKDDKLFLNFAIQLFLSLF